MAAATAAAAAGAPAPAARARLEPGLYHDTDLQVLTVDEQKAIVARLHLNARVEATLAVMYPNRTGRPIYAEGKVVWITKARDTCVLELTVAGIAHTMAVPNDPTHMNPMLMRLEVWGAVCNPMLLLRATIRPNVFCARDVMARITACESSIVALDDAFISNLGVSIIDPLPGTTFVQSVARMTACFLTEAYQAATAGEDLAQWRSLRVELLQGLLDQLMIARLKAGHRDVAALVSFIDDHRNSLRCRRAVFKQCQLTPYQKEKATPALTTAPAKPRPHDSMTRPTVGPRHVAVHVSSAMRRRARRAALWSERTRHDSVRRSGHRTGQGESRRSHIVGAEVGRRDPTRSLRAGEVFGRYAQPEVIPARPLQRGQHLAECSNETLRPDRPFREEEGLATPNSVRGQHPVTGVTNQTCRHQADPSMSRCQCQGYGAPRGRDGPCLRSSLSHAETVPVCSRSPPRNAPGGLTTSPNPAAVRGPLKEEESQQIQSSSRALPHSVATEQLAISAVRGVAEHGAGGNKKDGRKPTSSVDVDAGNPAFMPVGCRTHVGTDPKFGVERTASESPCMMQDDLVPKHSAVAVAEKLIALSSAFPAHSLPQPQGGPPPPWDEDSYGVILDLGSGGDIHLTEPGGKRIPRAPLSREEKDAMTLAETSTNVIDTACLLEDFPELQQTLAPILDVTVFESLFTDTDAACPRDRRRPISRDMSRHLPDMKKYDILEIDPSVASTAGLLVVVWCTLFLVPKKIRSLGRLVIDARPINRRQKKPPPMNLPRMHDVVRTVLSWDQAAKCDGKSFFYQFVLNSKVARYFRSRIAGLRGRITEAILKRLPMGWSFSPGIAQHVGNAITRGLGLAWVDDFIIGGDKSHFLFIRRAFQERLKRYNIEVDDPSLEPTENLIALGLQFDLAKKVYRIDPAWIEKRREGLNDLFKQLTEESASFRKVFELYGSLIWADYVTESPLWLRAESLAALKALAKSIPAGNYDAPCQLPDYASKNLRLWIDSVLENKWIVPGVTHDEADWDTILFSDASSSGGAWIRIFKDQITGGEQWSYEQDCHIFLREVEAMCEAARANPHPVARTIQYVDNTAAVGCARRGHSSSYLANVMLRETYGRSRPRVSWIDTLRQLADPYTRGVFLPTHLPCALSEQQQMVIATLDAQGLPRNRSEQNHSVSSC